MDSKQIGKRIDAIRTELRQNGKDMGGINPKLSTYKKLQERNDKLNQELQELTNNR